VAVGDLPLAVFQTEDRRDAERGRCNLLGIAGPNPVALNLDDVGQVRARILRDSLEPEDDLAVVKDRGRPPQCTSDAVVTRWQECSVSRSVRRCRAPIGRSVLSYVACLRQPVDEARSQAQRRPTVHTRGEPLRAGVPCDAAG
jgi:hypothetical protein